MENYDYYKGRKSGIYIEIIETGDVFETRTACAEFLGVSVGLITMCLNGRVGSCNGYHLRAVEGYIDYDKADIYSKLFGITGITCDWKEHPFLRNVLVSDNGMVARMYKGHLYVCNQHVNNSGYLAVSISDISNSNNRGPYRLVHRLVAETYIPNPDHKETVNHIDGNKQNNCIENLEWSTYSENSSHAYRTGLHKGETVRVVETGKVYPTSVACAEDIGGTVSGIHDCKSGRQKQHRGYHFEFPDEEE